MEPWMILRNCPILYHILDSLIKIPAHSLWNLFRHEFFLLEIVTYWIFLPKSCESTFRSSTWRFFAVMPVLNISTESFQDSWGFSQIRWWFFEGSLSSWRSLIALSSSTNIRRRSFYFVKNISHNPKESRAKQKKESIASNHFRLIHQMPDSLIFFWLLFKIIKFCRR